MNILSNLVPKFGLGNSKPEESKNNSDLQEVPTDLSIVEGNIVKCMSNILRKCLSNHQIQLKIMANR
jgi:hypothetical protein